MQTIASPLHSAPTEPTPTSKCLSSVTPAIVQKLFPATPVAHISANLPAVLAALAAANLADKSMLLVALATIRAETECFQPLSERPSRFNTSPNGHPFDLYDHRKELGNQGPPDGADFCGRGFVQLTGRANYAQFARETAHDLIANPALACEPAIAADLLARFLAHKEAAIRHALAAHDLAAVRRLVNGGSHGLDRFISAFQIGDSLLE